MKKYSTIFLFVLLLNSCCEKESIRKYVDMYEIMENECKTRKPSMICLVDNYDDIQAVKKNKSMIEGFTCYLLKKQVEDVFTKIMYPSTYPLYIVFKKDSIVSLFYGDEMNELLEMDNKEELNHILLSSKSMASAEKNITYLNALLKLYFYLEKKNNKMSLDLCYLNKLIKSSDNFYGKYLLAQLYKDIDVTKSEEIYNDLWTNSTSDEIKEYPKEFIEILRNKNHLALVEKEDIKFDYMEYDFGEVSMSEEVSCMFYFVNKSNVKFVIHNITTTCGCTVPFWNKQPINSNSRDSISVKFRAKDLGTSQKTIIIEGNCKQKIELKIRASICN